MGISLPKPSGNSTVANRLLFSSRLRIEYTDTASNRTSDFTVESFSLFSNHQHAS
jgi:hypothetical protein